MPAPHPFPKQCPSVGVSGTTPESRRRMEEGRRTEPEGWGEEGFKTPAPGRKKSLSVFISAFSFCELWRPPPERKCDPNVPFGDRVCLCFCSGFHKTHSSPQGGIRENRAPGFLGLTTDWDRRPGPRALLRCAPGAPRRPGLPASPPAAPHLLRAAALPHVAGSSLNTTAITTIKRRKKKE